MNSENFGVVTIANTDFYYELAKNLAKSCKLFNVPVTVLTDKHIDTDVFDRQIIIDIPNTYFEEIWLLKPNAINKVDHYDIACYVDADSLMFNSYEPCIAALGDRGFMQPNFKFIPENSNWAFKRSARSVARDYGIADDRKLSMLNGGYFCWRVGHDESYQWVAEFYKALRFMKDHHLGIRDESAMFLAHMKMNLSQEYYKDTMSCLWTTSARRYDDTWKIFTCKDEFGEITTPTFGHYGSGHIIPVVGSFFTYEYSDRVKILNELL